MLRKIVYLTPLYFDEQSCLGGGERLPLNLARGVIESSGGSCTVELVSYGAEPSWRSLGPGLSLRVLRIDNRPANRCDVVSWDLPQAIAGASLVHIHSPFTRCNEMGMLVAKLQHKPIFVTDHGGPTSALGTNLGMLDMADRIIPYSDFGATFFQTRTPIHVIKGGVDGTFFHPPEQPPQRDRVLFVGRLLPHKGVDLLIEALPPDLHLTIFGRPYHAGYYEHLRTLARGKSVEFVLDAYDDVLRDLYRRAWVNVLPSLYRDRYGQTYAAPELMGLTTLEAMACGTPGICTRVGGMPEFVREGETGFIVADRDELTDRLRLLANNPALVERMGRLARQTVVEEYDIKVTGRKLLQLYREVLTHYQEAAA
jgi:glycosyltransferase involved in cell wall biosynthesis